jgi:hypothetical protein
MASISRLHLLRFWNNDVLTNPEGIAVILAEAL